MNLTRTQRNDLIREAHAYRAEQDRWSDDVACWLTTRLFDDPQYQTDEVDPIEVSDYAYGIAAFVCKD
jgi:hypothetical protein